MKKDKEMTANHFLKSIFLKEGLPVPTEVKGAMFLKKNNALLYLKFPLEGITITSNKGVDD